VSDGRLDNVFTTRHADSMLLLNVNDREVEKVLTLPNGATRTVTMPGNSITEVPLAK
jgi:hypothetical protein